MKGHMTKSTFLLAGILLISTFTFSQENEITTRFSFAAKRNTNRFVIKNFLEDLKIVAKKNNKDSKCTYCIHTWIKYDSTYANQFAGDGYYRELLATNNEGKDFIYTVKSDIPNSYSFSIPRKLRVLIDNTDVPTERLNASKLGNITVEGVESEININTLSSNIVLRDVSGPVVISSISGDVDVEFSSDNIVGPISIGVLSGNITLRIPSTANVSINASNLYGEINTDFDATQNPIQTDKKTGIKTFKSILNRGGNSISLTTGSGNIKILKY